MRWTHLHALLGAWFTRALEERDFDLAALIGATVSRLLDAETHGAEALHVLLDDLEEAESRKRDTAAKRNLPLDRISAVVTDLSQLLIEFRKPDVLEPVAPYRHPGWWSRAVV